MTRRVGCLDGAPPAASPLPDPVLDECGACCARARAQAASRSSGSTSTPTTAARSFASAARSSCPCSSTASVVLSDSPVILEYLEERFPERPLYPADPARRAELRTFVDWFNRVWKRPPNLLVAEELKAEPDLEPDRRARAADRRRAAALRGSARRARLPLRRRALRRRRRRLPVPQVRGALGGRRRGALPRGAAGYSAARRPLSAARSLDPPDGRAAASVGGEENGALLRHVGDDGKEPLDAPDPDARDRAVPAGGPASRSGAGTPCA